MRDRVAVPKTNAGRESQNKLFLWITWLDLLIIAITAVLPAFLVIFLAKISSWWIFLILAVAIGWSAFITFPFGGTKIYYGIWDAVFRWWFSTKKHYSKQQAEHSFNLLKEVDGLESNFRSYKLKIKKLGEKEQFSAFYEITPNDISLANGDELEIYLDKFNSLFALTDDVNFSIVKIDWPYNFKTNIDWLENNFQIWKDKKVNDKDLRQLNLVEKIEQVNALQNSNNITQKRYFLIINADNVDKIKRVFEIINNDLYDAGLRISPASSEATNACISKLIPSLEVEKSIDFFRRGYVIDKSIKNKAKYYRTIIVTNVDKIVEPFWNQGIFNMDETTIHMVMKSIESTITHWNKDPKQRYINF